MRDITRGLLDSFDEMTIARGMQYADTGAVIEITEGERGVTATVHGTRRSPYNVHVPFGRGPSAPLEPSSGVCTCPMAVSCKHIVAVTATYYGDAFGSIFDTDEQADDEDDAGDEEALPTRYPRPMLVRPGRLASAPDRAHTRESLLQELGRVMKAPAGPADIVLPIAGTGAPRGYSRVEEIMRPHSARKAPPGERWRLAFMVSGQPHSEWRQRQGSSAPEDSRRAFIAPASQYIRKDGVPSRVEKYREDRVHEPGGRGSDALLEKLAINGGEAPLLLHLDHVLAHADIPIYPTGPDGRGRYDQPLRSARIHRIRIGFTPVPQEEYDTRDLHVRPVLRMDLEDGGGTGAALKPPGSTRGKDAWQPWWTGDGWAGARATSACSPSCASSLPGCRSSTVDSWPS
jgi:hypothetical protein